MTTLHSVTGGSLHCGPCALSAMLGVPAAMWPDRGMELQELDLIASEQPGAVRLARDDYAIGRPLASFGNRRTCGAYNGVWLLVLGITAQRLTWWRCR